MGENQVTNSPSLEKLVLQNITNTNELKTKLNEIIKLGQYYKYDVSDSIQYLLKSLDPEILKLSLQAVAELSKCESKRQSFTKKEIIEDILKVLSKNLNEENIEVIKQSCRALGNLCCDCDEGRAAILELNGVPVLINLLRKAVESIGERVQEIKILTAKTILNFIIGGQEVTQAVVDHEITDVINKTIAQEVAKSVMNDEIVSTMLIILSVICDNISEFSFSNELNSNILKVLRETTNIDISELCFEHLHSQAEHDAVKTLLAREGGVQLICSRLEMLVLQETVSNIRADDADVEAVMKQACDLIVIILTGDESMHHLYASGFGEVYQTMVRWLSSQNNHLLTTAVLAIGNFARQDSYCLQMMESGIFDLLIELFEKYHRINTESSETDTASISVPIKIEHAVLSALRNILVAKENKKCERALQAAPLLVAALPDVKDHNVAYKLMGALRMMVDGNESVSRSICESEKALAAITHWGGSAGGAGGEAPRLLAHCIVRAPTAMPVKVEGCVTALVNMLVSTHSIMQNEAILSLTILTAQTSNKPQYDIDFTQQLISSEIGKHVSVLIESNCAKMPTEVAHNLITLLELSCKRSALVNDFKEANVNECLRKLAESRKDVSDDLKRRCGVVLAIIDDFDG